MLLSSTLLKSSMAKRTAVTDWLRRLDQSETDQCHSPAILDVKSGVFAVLVIASAAMGSDCLVKPVEPKPLPPLGYSDVVQACVCDERGLNCVGLGLASKVVSPTKARL